MLHTSFNIFGNFQAGRNYAEDSSLEDIKKRCNIIRSDHSDLPTRYHDTDGVQIPDDYDSRKIWSNCESIGMIRDEGDCGASYSYAAVDAIADRICIATKGQQKVELSALDLVSCGGQRCSGGDPMAAWKYWVSKGIVSEACQPYPYPPCNHGDSLGPYKPCGHNMPDPKCVRKCVDKSNKKYKKDLNHGYRAYKLPEDELMIKIEILRHGPIEVAINVYDDLLTYKSGVYRHISQNQLGGRALKLIGWGVENGVKYWLCANSWNAYWGDKGYIKIQRGVDECGIESYAVAGEPITWA
ncbi:ctsb [Cordylochernes scorpioides]|uniref:Ctsb n=1 Tax=Cordylochernes scorpioides TaxID=51811 RepID=A0ABY6K609_9ARAC|nr:ctsb [Cordylochernes scorpioides]